MVNLIQVLFESEWIEIGGLDIHKVVRHSEYYRILSCLFLSSGALEFIINSSFLILSLDTILNRLEPLDILGAFFIPAIYGAIYAAIFSVCVHGTFTGLSAGVAGINVLLLSDHLLDNHITDKWPSISWFMVYFILHFILGEAVSSVNQYMTLATYVAATFYIGVTRGENFYARLGFGLLFYMWMTFGTNLFRKKQNFYEFIMVDVAMPPPCPQCSK